MAGTNSGASGANLCDDANGNATTSGCPAYIVAPAGTQNQQMQIMPNTGNNTTFGMVTKPRLITTDYAYTPIAPGGSLTGGGGAQTMTLAICPLGIYGDGFWSPVYISGGTGTAEVQTPVGGTCLAATPRHSGRYRHCQPLQ